MSNIFNKKGALIDAINQIRESVSKEYADEHKQKAMAARNSGKMSDYHKHMATHHDHMASHFNDKGDSRAADLHMNKATEHEAKAKEVSEAKCMTKEAKLDKVQPAELKKDHSERKDKDIDNDGDVDSSDEYLHKRRQAISKSMKSEGFSESEIANLLDTLDEATPTSQQVKQGIGIARDKRYAGGNMTGAVKAMDKLNKGLARHPAVEKELKKQNEEVEDIKEYEMSRRADGKYVDDEGNVMSAPPSRWAARKVTSDRYRPNPSSSFSYKSKYRKEEAEIEEEQIDELSKKTLGSYAKKAMDQATSASSLAGQYGHSRGTYVFSKEPQDDSRKNFAAAAKNVASKRSQGVKKAIDRLTKEEVEMNESHFALGDKVKCKASGMSGKVIKLDKEDGAEDEKYYTVKRDDGKEMKYAPNELSLIKEEKLEEKAESQVQATAARIALAAKRGKIPMSKLQGASKDMVKMSEKDLEDFSKAKKDAPERVEEEFDIEIQEAEQFAGWIAHHNGKKLEIRKHEAKDLYGAKQKAIAHFKPKKSQQHMVSVQPAYEEVDSIVEQSDKEEKHEMAQTQAHFIKYAAEEILEYIEMGGEIEEWYQNKLSKVHSDMESLHSYMEGEKRRTGMDEDESKEDDLEEAKELSPKQNLLLRAMATDPQDINKMRRAIKLGDKALMNPVMRQEILKMLDQMMDVSLSDPTIFSKTRQIFKKRRATDTTNTE